jgi:hypothetical protein
MKQLMDRPELVEKIGIEKVQQLERLHCRYDRAEMDNRIQIWSAHIDIDSDNYETASIYYRVATTDIGESDDSSSIDWPSAIIGYDLL